jgi:hypothetical protein
MRARPRRIAKRGKRRTAVRISFTLTAPTRVVFVVRGPAPSCGVVGRFNVRGNRGVNHFDFTGRVGRRELSSGAYRVSVTTGGRPASRSVVVVVGDGARSSRFECHSPRPPASMFVSMLEVFAIGGGTPGAGLAGWDGDAQAAARNPSLAGDGPESGVLPAVTDRLRRLPEDVPKPQVPGARPSPPWILGTAALLVLALSSLVPLVYVLRFLRRPRAT